MNDSVWTVFNRQPEIRRALAQRMLIILDVAPKGMFISPTFFNKDNKRMINDPPGP